LSNFDKSKKVLMTQWTDSMTNLNLSFSMTVIIAISCWWSDQV
jgi:hypothetical protein